MIEILVREQPARTCLTALLQFLFQPRHVLVLWHWLRSGLIDRKKFRPVEVLRLPLDRDLGYQSKLDRRPEFLKELMEYGRAKSRWFLKEREQRTQSLQTLDDTSSHASSEDGEAAVEVLRSGA